MIGDLCFATISGQGPDGYREALERLREELDEGDAVSGDARWRASRSASRRTLRERELDVLLVATRVDVRYLTGFTGTTGWR